MDTILLQRISAVLPDEFWVKWRHRKGDSAIDTTEGAMVVVDHMSKGWNFMCSMTVHERLWVAKFYKLATRSTHPMNLRIDVMTGTRMEEYTGTGTTFAEAVCRACVEALEG